MSAEHSKDELLGLLRQNNCEMTLRQKFRLTVLLSVPAVIAQLSSIMMQVIDAAMVGHLSTDEAAAVGLVSTTIWLFSGLISAFASGFAVQVAHRVGAGDMSGARMVVRQGMVSGIMFSLLLVFAGLSVAPWLPLWLGADAAISADATRYFSIFACGMPLIVLNSVAAGSLRCSGNVKVPSALMVMLCTLDVLFNYIFIFRCGMGTAGAAYGTLVAYAITMLVMVYSLTFRDRHLRFSNDTAVHGLRHYMPRREIVGRAGGIGLPIGLERTMLCTAQIAISSIIAPFGSVAIAANTFAINVESLCYMPGHGISEAATTLVGQSKGALRRDLMHSFAWISMFLGVSVMAFMGLVMWVFAPGMMSVITPDAQVIALGSEILRIEAWAEPCFAAAIIANGVFIGAGRTLVPSLMNLCSIWGVRVTLTLALAPTMGLRGVWVAMAAELCVRGTIFVIRLCTKGWSRMAEVKQNK
ncbi:MAG: MATE family efflux transporter [Prevotellaceae bacterium]|nr:MATE family efflux transporter [Prevotellaceae bacterium]MDO4931104.1 MATE family efflux transporter [Prevotellaceae bacterium]